MLARRDDRAVTPHIEQACFLLIIVVPHRHRIQTTASPHVVVSETSRTESSVAWLNSGSAETFATADTGARISVREEHRWRNRQQLALYREIVDAMNVDDLRPPLTKLGEGIA